MTRGELLARATSAELSEWMVYDRVFGLGDNLEVLGAVCSTVARSFGGNRNATAESFVPYFQAGRAGLAQTPEEMLATFTAVASATNRRA